MPVFNIGQHPDNAIYKFVFIHYDQRGHICPHKPSRPVRRGHADAPGRQRFDDFQRTSPNTLVRIDGDRTTLKVGMHVLNKIEDRNPGLLKTCAPGRDHTGIDPSKNA